jgi:hypothetical protein
MADPGLFARVKALLACSAILVFALGLSWALPFVFFDCARLDERVDCVVQQRLLGLIPFQVTDVYDVRGAAWMRVEGELGGGGEGRTTDADYVVLTNFAGAETSFMSGSDKGVAQGIERFLADGGARTHSTWTVPLMGYASVAVAALGALFTSLVLWDMAATRLSKRATHR